MLRLRLGLVALLCVLSPAIPKDVFATSQETKQEDIVPSDVKTSGSQAHRTFTMSGPHGYTDTAEARRSVSTDNPKNTNYRGRNDMQDRKRRQTHVAPDVLSVIEMVKTLSQDVQRLADEVKRHKTAIVEGFEALKRDTAQRLNKLDPVPGQLHDLTDRFNEFQTSSSDKFKELSQKLDKNEAFLHNLESDSVQSANLSAQRISTIEASLEKLQEVPAKIDEIKKEAALYHNVTKEDMGHTLKQVQGLESCYRKTLNSSRPRQLVRFYKIAQYIKNAEENGEEDTFSEPFFIDGHTGQLRLHFSHHADSKDTHLSVWFYFCTGSKDSHPTWFARESADVTLSIFHPLDFTRDIHTSANLIRFSWPVQKKMECVYRYGAFANMLDAEALLKDGYVDDDGMTIGVTLDQDV